jgi:hypothetical protein
VPTVKTGVPIWMLVRSPAALENFFATGVDLLQTTKKALSAEIYWSSTLPQKETSALVQKIHTLRTNAGITSTEGGDEKFLLSELEKDRSKVFNDWVKSGHIDPKTIRFEQGQSLIEWQVQSLVSAVQPQVASIARSFGKHLPVLNWFAKNNSPGAELPMPGFSGLTVAECLFLFVPLNTNKDLHWSALAQISASLPRTEWIVNLIDKMEVILASPNKLSFEAKTSLIIALRMWSRTILEESCGRTPANASSSILVKTGFLSSEVLFSHSIPLKLASISLRLLELAYKKGAKLTSAQNSCLSHICYNGAFFSYGSPAALRYEKLWALAHKKEREPESLAMLESLAVMELAFSNCKGYAVPPKYISWALKNATLTLQQLKLFKHGGFSEFSEPWFDESWLVQAEEKLLDKTVATANSSLAPRMRL